MEKKIIELTSVEPGNRTCLLCCDKPATVKLTINRVKYDDTITFFNACDECLVRMQKDIEVCK